MSIEGEGDGEDDVNFYGSQEFELDSYFSWTAGGKSWTEMAEIIFSPRQFLSLILILLANLSNKNIKKKTLKNLQAFLFGFIRLLLLLNIFQP